MKRLTITVLTVVGICASIFFGEWVYTEVKFQIWLRTDKHRIDFSIYNSEQEVKDALLAKLPIGSSAEQVREFYEANDDNNSRWKPEEHPGGRYGVILLLPVSRRGSIVTKETQYWFLIFNLDKATQDLIDIEVHRYTPPLWP